MVPREVTSERGRVNAINVHCIGISTGGGVYGGVKASMVTGEMEVLVDEFGPFHPFVQILGLDEVAGNSRCHVRGYSQLIQILCRLFGIGSPRDGDQVSELIV